MLGGLLRTFLLHHHSILTTLFLLGGSVIAAYNFSAASVACTCGSECLPAGAKASCVLGMAAGVCDILLAVAAAAIVPPRISTWRRNEEWQKRKRKQRKQRASNPAVTSKDNLS